MMAYVLDLLVILVVAFCIWSGWRKGFVKTLGRLLAFVLALLVALLLSGPLAESLYDGTVAPEVEETLTTHLVDDSTRDMTAKADNALDALPGYIRNLLGNGGVTDGASLMEQVDPTAPAAAIAHEVQTTVVRPLVVPLMEMLLAFVLFSVTSLLGSLLVRLLDKFCRLPLLRSLNRGLGLIPGAINGVLWALILACVAQVLAVTGTSDSLITPTVLADTTLLEWLVSINPFGDVVTSILGVMPQ